MEQIDYLRSLRAIRERCYIIYNQALRNQTNHFELNIDKLDSVADFVISLIKRDYQNIDMIKPHTRWRHFEFDGELRLQNLINTRFSCDLIEKTRRIIDLIVVSVLLDAGAGDKWSYLPASTDQTNPKKLNRSEGLAIASFDMFVQGCFSSDDTNPYQVDAVGLSNLTLEMLKEGFQVTDQNTLIGLEKRLELLIRLGSELSTNSIYFGPNNNKSPSRPGNMIDFLIRKKQVGKPHDLFDLWDIVINGFSKVWPETNIRFNSVSLGDVWGSDNLNCRDPFKPKFEELVPFHKLSQWLTYSIIEPIEVILDEKFINKHLLTGLPEYRNEVIRLKNNQHNNEIPTFRVFDYATVEWRALTVALLDKTAELIRQKLNLNEEQLSLAKVLEAGTWKAGREIAAEQRPSTKGPPIITISDGTIF